MAESFSSATDCTKQKSESPANEAVPPYPAHVPRERRKLEEKKTEAAFPSLDDSTRHKPSFQDPYRSKPKQVYRRKKRFERTENAQDAQLKSVEGSLERPTSSADRSNNFRRHDSDFGQRTVQKSTVASSRSNDSQKRFPGKFPRKYRGKKENPANELACGTSGDQLELERGERVVEKSQLQNNSKSTERSSESVSEMTRDANQKLPETFNKRDFRSHGVVTEGVYIRKGKPASEPGSQKKQWSNDMDTRGKSFQRQDAGTIHSSVSIHPYFAKKSVDGMSHVGRIPGSDGGKAFDKGSQSSVQASVLIEQLTDEKYECMVCCEVIKCAKAVWCCSNCYHIFHLFCIKRWARSPVALVEDGGGKTSGWRCPACQFVEHNVPNVYRCFCGKVEEPKWYPHDGITPHSCGELCLRKRIGKDCPHLCNQLCHPGPCPSCPVTVTKKCCCGKTTIPVRCGKSKNVTCSSVCGKLLNCGVHSCEENCHLGACKMCSVIEEQNCYCGKSKREANCGSGSSIFISGKPRFYSCGAVCSKKLDCGNHECDQICHASECNSCDLRPDVVIHCPCGREKILDLLNGSNRSSCLDPIPTCTNSCDRLLPCAKFNDMTKTSSDHRCKKLCHHGDCSTCGSDSIVKCRCRATSKKLPCAELNVTGEPYLCELKCNKKLHCGRHRCNQKCCPGTEHQCNLICGKRLKCGKHKCMEMCHSGTCPPCLMAGFDEVFCHCGATVQEPPIPCGKPPPECHKPCARMHPCQHEVQHNCHYEEGCPPCTILVSKWCMGGHKLRHNIPCHIESVSCGEQCGKTLSCGYHKCLKMCHKGPCFEENEECKQLCTSPRESCGHPCDALCHTGECPKIPCKSKIRVYCKCGRKSEDAVCLKGGDKMEVAQAYQRFTTKNLAEKIKGLQEGQSVDISGLMNLDEKKSQLDCDEECAIEQRNRTLAEAFGISQSDSNRDGTVQFAHFLEEHGKANMKFLYFVEDALEDLVKAVLKVQSQTLTHSFPPMNNKNRRFVHELAQFYGCSSISYDKEPNRNTVVTATKESRSPRVKLSSHIQRQTNPQPPPPVPVLPDQGIGNVRFIPRKSQEKNVDYFEDDF